MAPQSALVNSSVSDDRPDLDGLTAGGAFGAAEQRAGSRSVAGRGRVMDLAEHRVHRDGRGADRAAGGGAGRGVGRPERGGVRGRPRPVPRLAHASRRRQRGDGRPARNRGHRLHHRPGRDADAGRVGRQPRHPRGVAGDEFLRHQHDPDRAQRGRLRPDVDSGLDRDGQLPGGLDRGGGLVTEVPGGAADRAHADRCVLQGLPAAPGHREPGHGLADEDRFRRLLEQRLRTVELRAVRQPLLRGDVFRVRSVPAAYSAIR